MPSVVGTGDDAVIAGGPGGALTGRGKAEEAGSFRGVRHLFNWTASPAWRCDQEVAVLCRCDDSEVFGFGADHGGERNRAVERRKRAVHLFCQGEQVHVGELAVTTGSGQ